MPAQSPNSTSSADRIAPTGSAGSSLGLSRRSLLAGAAAAGPLLALSTGPAHARPNFAGGFRDIKGLTRIGEWVHEDVRTVDFRFNTHGMVRTFDPSLRVTVPASYASNPHRRYPVLLLLHGNGGDYRQWTNEGNVWAETEKHDVIVVMPDAATSFYSNVNYPLPRREAAWESYIMDQVLPFVHANFRTDPHRMAIAGLSMGGWGALSLGQRYWGHFRSVSSYSGPADCNPFDSTDGALVRGVIWIAPALEWGKNPRPNVPGAVWGGAPYSNLVRGYNPIANLDKFKGKRVFLRTGDGKWGDVFDLVRATPGAMDRLAAKLKDFGVGDIIEAVVHPNLERFHHALNGHGIANDFRIDRGRTHEWGLWQENFTEDLPGMMRVLNA